MKKISSILVGSLLVLAACGDDDGSEEATVDMDAGQQLYEEHCLSCHGQNMEGDVGPDITIYPYRDVLTAIEEGPGTMPEDIIEGEEAETVAQYVEAVNQEDEEE
ncbi:cytochrome c [Geomicrobium sp. JSM 1781026]|uniref:c-type cytochrome n=1 Tax=Geomicrobium sp. JSM 1781026 TaxID=3344580 RepID=UPI0035C0D062